MAWEEPKLDWVTNPKNPTNEDMNRIEGNIAQLKTDIETKKGAIVDAVNNIGGNTSIEKTYQEIANEINSLKLSGDATAAQVLSGKTFYNSNPKSKLVGTMPSKGAQTYTPGTTNQTIAAGQYLSGAQTIKGDANLVSSNIVKGKSIFGVTGTAVKLSDPPIIYHAQCGVQNNIVSGPIKNGVSVNISDTDIYIINSSSGMSGGFGLVCSNKSYSFTSKSAIKVMVSGSRLNSSYGKLFIGVLPSKVTGDLGGSTLSTYFTNNGGTYVMIDMVDDRNRELDVSTVTGNQYIYIGVFVGSDYANQWARIYGISLI